MNFGGLVLQALLEHWPRTYTEENPENGEQDAGGDTEKKRGNPYFNVPAHTPVIFRWGPLVNQLLKWLFCTFDDILAWKYKKSIRLVSGDKTTI